MNPFNLYLAIALVYILSACSGEKTEVAHIEKKTAIPYALLPENIYRPDSITASLENAGLQQKAESRRLFMTGLDLLANKNDALASVEYFKEAIYYYPDEKNYLHLFKAYLKSGQLALADSTNYSLYGRINYDEVSFNSALVSASKKDTTACIEYLMSAAEQGFAMKDRITEEKLFEFLADNQSYQSLLVTYYGDDEKLRKKLFAAFIKETPKIRLPFSMISDSASSFNFDRYINYDFAAFIPGMESSRFSRDVSNEYMYVGTFASEGGQAVIYKSYQVIADTLNPVSVNLIVYDSLGKVISQQEIGCFCSPLESKGFTLFEDYSLEVVTYKTNWQFDPLEKGYANNKVVSKEQTNHQTYKITKENSVKETHTPAEMTAAENKP
ncbi:hypothetical protein CNR22_11455 [Sphingobacteriaceae bacterium]|nr:hypothetical protein CNR22_11455 [Sphingobacteriaceae bacterium]